MTQYCTKTDVRIAGAWKQLQKTREGGGVVETDWFTAAVAKECRVAALSSRATAGSWVLLVKIPLRLQMELDLIS